MMMTVIPLTLLQRICYTHAVAPVILYSVILTVLLFHMDLISTGDRIMILFLDYWYAVRVVPEQVWAPFIRMLSLFILQSRSPSSTLCWLLCNLQILSQESRFQLSPALFEQVLTYARYVCYYSH